MSTRVRRLLDSGCRRLRAFVRARTGRAKRRRAARVRAPTGTRAGAQPDASPQLLELAARTAARRAGARDSARAVLALVTSRAAPWPRVSFTPSSRAAAPAGSRSGARRSTSRLQTELRRSSALPPVARSSSSATRPPRRTGSIRSSSTGSRATALHDAASSSGTPRDRPLARARLVPERHCRRPIRSCRRPTATPRSQRALALGRRGARADQGGALEDRPASRRAPRRRRPRTRAVAARRGRPDAQPARVAPLAGRGGRSRSCARAIRTRISRAAGGARAAARATRDRVRRRRAEAVDPRRRRRDLVPRAPDAALEELGVPVLLPSAWVRSPAPLRANLKARAQYRPSSGLLSTTELAAFDWRVAVGDVELGDEELLALAAAKSTGRAGRGPLARAAARRTSIAR